MKMITGLTKANIKNTGIELSPEHDFTDDGNKFRGFIYKGMPMTQCRADGECYLAIRVDYLENQFTWEEWSKTKEYNLEDEFNGVSEFDLDKLIENLEAIIVKRDEMNAKAAAEDIDMTEVIAKVNEEIKKVEIFLDNVKKDLKWWELSKYELSSAKEDMEWLTKQLENARKIDFEKLDRRSKKQYVERLGKSYVVLDLNCYWASNLRKLMK